MKFLRWFRQLWKLHYDYHELSERHRASGLIGMAIGTAIGATLGMIFQLIQNDNPATALFAIGDTTFGAAKTAYLMLWVISLILLPFVISLLNQGKLNSASNLYIIMLYIIALLGYVTTDLTSFLMITFSMPVIAAGVLLDRRGLVTSVVVVIATIISVLLLDSAGLMTRITVGTATFEDALIFGTLVFIVDGIILYVFAGGQRILYERNLQLTRELQEATIKAQETSRLKSEFLATMSHELRTPLNAMLGFSGILLEGMRGEIDEDARRMVSRIDANSKRLLNTINDILDISKIEAGRLEIVSVPMSPRALASAWHSQIEILAKQKKLDFTLEIDPELPESLYGDPERTTQIASNLLSNAVKFTERGSIHLTLRQHDSHWEIEVKDTGVGIPPHALNYIFDQFRQVDGSFKRAYGGSGLGLAIARNLARMMNGDIRVVSSMGDGSTFTVTLPLHPAAVHAIAS